MLRSLVILMPILVEFLVAGSAVAQPSDIQVLSTADATFPHPFSSVVGIRELHDGRLVVSDRIEQSLSLIDFDSGTVRALGRVGEGPGEFRMPGILLPLRGDSTLLVDVGNMRMTIIGPGGITTQSTPLMRPNGQPLSPTRSDTSGTLYTAGSTIWMFGPGSPGQLVELDSMPISAWNLQADVVDTVCYLSMQGRERRRARYGEADLTRFFPPAFAARDGWAVAPDGRVALVFAEDYHIEWVLPNGNRIVGPSIPYNPIPVTTQEKQRWIAQVSEGTVLAVSGEPEGGATTQRMPTPSMDDISWPQYKPPFDSDLVFVTPEGTLWVGRQVAMNEPQIFDVFNEEGKRIRSVILPQGRRIVGFGSRSLFTVRTDEVDLLWLERYAR